MTDLFGLQLETIEAIIVSLSTAFVGTGTVAMIAKVALGRFTKTLADKVKQAESANEISSKNAETTIKVLQASNDVLKGQIDALQTSILKLVESNTYTAEKFQSLMDEYQSRDEKIKQLIVQEFGDIDE
jgi:chromosome segregation ATPase